MRSLLLFVIGLIFGTTGGFLVAGGMGESSHDHDHAGHSDAAHDHSALTPWDGDEPRLDLILLPDMGSNLNMHILTEGFVFAPEQVNGPNTQGTGHAHVYVNGEKALRAYSAWVHLTDVPEGATVRVTLNANDHTGWAFNGEPIAAEATAP